ncbi:MAG: hypothetical protein VX777_07055 [Chlamydiota bacterium]|nr:hypothetical protein [Chlamydiota bacterium]
MNTITADSSEKIFQHVANEKVTDGLYVRKKEESLYFVMERMTGENVEFWSKFYSEEQKIAKKSYRKSMGKVQANLIAGYMGFKDALQSYGIYQRTSPHEVWVLYASTTSISKDVQCAPENIEMVCTVSTSENVPFTTHMGITRTSRFAQKTFDEMIRHPSISMDLHAYGAQVMKFRYPEKVHMITTPMKVMEEIFKKTLGEDNVFIGYEEGWEDYLTECKAKLAEIISSADSTSEQSVALTHKKRHLEETVAYYTNLVEASGESPILTLGKGMASFNLKDLNRKTILSLNEDEIDNFQSIHAWYFKRDSTFSSVNLIVAISLDALMSYNKL